MLNKVWFSFSLAVQSIRNRFFHTILSVLGIVIGVAALVAILSLIDGLEKYANEQISQNTTINTVMFAANPITTVDNIRLRRDSFPYLDYEAYRKLRSDVKQAKHIYFFSKLTAEINLKENSKSTAAYITATVADYAPEFRIKHGKAFTEDDVEKREPLVVISAELAANLAGNDPAAIAAILGKKLVFRNKILTISGILEEAGEQGRAEAFIPISLLSEEEIKANLPLGVAVAENMEQVPALKSEIANWLDINLKSTATDFIISTDETKLEQAAKGFLLFRIVMGIIVGISVIVGGVGIMNVLIISVNERISEIGIRKAIGAKKQDILLQFLIESIVVSAFGCLLGLLLGIAGTAITIPVIKAVAKVPFQAAYTLNTIMVIAIISVLIGIVFGTYPAIKAAKLDPVEAIRRE